MAFHVCSRRKLLETSMMLLGVGLLSAEASAQAVTALPSSIAAAAQNASASLPTISAAFQKLALPNALVSELTNIHAALSSDGGLSHNGKVRRIQTFAFTKDLKNPHVAPQGGAHSAREQQGYKPVAMSGGGV